MNTPNDTTPLLISFTYLGNEDDLIVRVPEEEAEKNCRYAAAAHITLMEHMPEHVNALDVSVTSCDMLSEHKAAQLMGTAKEGA